MLSAVMAPCCKGSSVVAAAGLCAALAACGTTDPTAVDAGAWELAGSEVPDAGPAEEDLYPPCMEDADCASNLCHEFSRVGRVCTTACTADAECAGAGARCNNRGLCRPP